jgi:two-component system NtrC family sensor kinase
VGLDRPCAGCPLAEALAGGSTQRVDVTTAAGRTLEVNAYPLPSENSRSEERSLAELEHAAEGARAVCTYRDVTESRAIAAELDRTRRLASLGLFVGGVAHEINNPLGSILAFTQILQDSRPDSDREVQDTLQEIESAAIRAKRIIESLLSFAQGSSLRHADLEPTTLIVDAVRAFTRDYGKGVPIEVEVDPALPKVRGDALLLHQLLRNLLQNGEQAMVGSSGGALHVSAKLAGEGDVAIEVTDAGRGIPPDVLPRIYDPFFTTKQNRGGTGLGLSICHRIVEQHGGTIEARSVVGVGTTFRVTLRGIVNDRMSSL